LAKSFDLKSYAHRGADVRLSELREEMNAIYAAFPDLRRGGPPQTRDTAAANGSVGRPARRRRRMTAAQRKAVSARMKKYWAARRKAKK
jgi:hypothetical protein